MAAHRIRRLLPVNYRRIDWHCDFKSSYRWHPATWYCDVTFGDAIGEDIKVPWELARMQHLPQLALAAACARHGTTGFSDASVYETEVRNQILDFISSNPPRFGVNWRCAMDVGIRIANWLLAYDLLRDGGFRGDSDFLSALAHSALDHARHLADNLEESGGFRGNHYLADVVGLLYAAAWLPESPDRTRWLDFVSAALARETLLQFGPDGGSFEASTTYHRLSTEMLLHAAALLAKLGRPLSDDAHRRLSAALSFSELLLKPDGRIPQIGDNDSGRFFKLGVVYRREAGADLHRRFSNIGPQEGSAHYWLEDGLDQRPLLRLGEALSGIPARSVEASIVAGLALQPLLSSDRDRPKSDIRRHPAPATPFTLGHYTIEVPQEGLRHQLQLKAFPSFGLYLYRSPRLYLLVRCGSIGQRGRGGHAHNDQLSLELNVDGEDWIVDPGTGLYTADPTLRNRYRSVEAHFAPRLSGQEPARLDRGLFWLPDDPKAQVHEVSNNLFDGSHSGFDCIVRRRIEIHESRIVIHDTCDKAASEPANVIVCAGRDQTRGRLQPRIPLSPAYGWLRRECGF